MTRDVRHPAAATDPFLIEALETTDSRSRAEADNVGTGPSRPPRRPLPGAARQRRLLPGPAPIDSTDYVETSYPSVRAAWAELLRGNLDMLYEVNVDALDSLQGSSNVSVFSFVRHYQ